MTEANVIRGFLPDGSMPAASLAQIGGVVDDAAAPHVTAAQAAQAAAEAAAATTIVGAGRPDIPATMTQAVRDRVAAAGSGAMFRSADGPQGAWEWQKRGSAWVVTQGDTGWVSAASLLPEGANDQGTQIRRTNQTVFVQILAGAVTVPADTTIFLLPVRFRPAVSDRYFSVEFQTGQAFRFVGSALRASQSLTNATIWTSATLVADSPWPTTLTI